MDAFDGKVVLITGGSSGIGRATALRLVGHGARIALVARSAVRLDEVVRLAKERGGQALAVSADVTDAEECRRAVATAVEHFGRLDILICSAGVSLRALFAESDLSVMEGIIRTNFLGTLYATHHALPHVIRSRGSLVAISSLTGKRGVPTYAVYGASKAAIQGLYESLRLELAPAGVHVGIVSPGFVDTPLRDRVLGPDGKEWDRPPRTPFRIWPVEKCVDRIVRLIARRGREALLPGFVGPLFAFDQLTSGAAGDWFLGRHFHPGDCSRR